ncbi:MAG: aminotransferase class III-fold pyridoxal phosphate-dependent enzyme, partial [Pseudomonadota bacterium]
GCRVWDTEDREYIDYTMAWGSALVGHSHPRLVDRVASQLSQGVNFAAMSAPLVELAERIAAVSPGLERVRFVSTGTEATMTCIRIARGATGRSKILKFEGAFHGSHVEGVANFFWSKQGGLPHAQDTGTGGASAVSDLLVSPYNDLEAAKQLIETHHNELAAIIIDPVQRSVLADRDFMIGLREVATSNNVLLIFDEVVSGFRLAMGGACEYYGVTPDLIAYGKAMGGGFPIAALGGREDIMDEVREDRHTTDRYVWAASTTGGGPVTATAALAVLDIMSEPDFYPHLYTMGKRLRSGIANTFHKFGIDVQVYGEGPLANFQFVDSPVTDMASESRADATLRRATDLEMVRRGIFINPMLTKIYVSAAHDETAIDTYLEALEQTLPRVCG